MTQSALYLIGAGCLVVLVILALGIAQFGKGGADGAKRSNKLMQARIIAQLAVVILVVVLVAVFKGS